MARSSRLNPPGNTAAVAPGSAVDDLGPFLGGAARGEVQWVVARYRLRRFAYYLPLIIALALLAGALIASADMAHRLATALYDWTRT
ncbi:hypothetical protein [Terrabacter terrigena]|uniref:Chloride channel protein n=1 Tax=Terrabacter terrigena TaxID=574718 RepID=A0ABW3N0J9_9MICO